jgi:hypothetical protein
MAVTVYVIQPTGTGSRVAWKVRSLSRCAGGGSSGHSMGRSSPSNALERRKWILL